MTRGTCLDRELAPKDPALGPIGLPPWLEGCTSVRRWSGDLAAAIGCEVAVKLAKGLWTRDWVDIIKTSIRIWLMRSLKSEYTAGENITTVGRASHVCSFLWSKLLFSGVTFFRVLVKLCSQWREKDDISILLLPRYAENLANELQGLFFRDIWVCRSFLRCRKKTVKPWFKKNKKKQNMHNEQALLSLKILVISWSLWLSKKQQRYVWMSWYKQKWNQE